MESSSGKTYSKNIWYPPLYILVPEYLLQQELGGDFGNNFPPGNAVQDSWVPAVLDPLLTAMQEAPLDPKSLPYLRPGKEIVDMKTRAANYEACEDMEPRVFHLEKEFLRWEKHQIEHQKHEQLKVQQQLPLTNEDLGQEEAKEDTSDEQDDAEVFNVMPHANRTSDPSGKPALPSAASDPV